MPAVARTELGYELFGYASLTLDDAGEADELEARADFTGDVAEANPDWQLDLNEMVLGDWRGDRRRHDRRSQRSQLLRLTESTRRLSVSLGGSAQRVDAVPGLSLTQRSVLAVLCEPQRVLRDERAAVYGPGLSHPDVGVAVAPSVP